MTSQELVEREAREDRRRFLAVVRFAKRVGIRLVRARSRRAALGAPRFHWSRKTLEENYGIVGPGVVTHNIRRKFWTHLLHEVGRCVCATMSEEVIAGWTVVAAVQIWGRRSVEVRRMLDYHARAGLTDMAAYIRRAKAHGLLSSAYTAWIRDSPPAPYY